MIKRKIKNSIRNSIRGNFSNIKNFEVNVEYPPQEEYGDYSSNIALSLSDKVGKPPLEIAKLLVEKLKEDKLFKEVSIKKPGFINLYLDSSVLKIQIEKILKEKENYGNLNIGKGKKVQVEFISANPTGPLTVGNARGGPVGDTLANILNKAGYKTEKAYYVNDYGNQILKLGHSVLKDDQAEYKGDYIDHLNEKIKESDPYKAGQKATEIIIEGVKETVGKMNIGYDEWKSEKELHESGLVDKVINLLKEKELTYKKEGALWFKSSDFGDKRDRVLIKSDENKTYLAADIAYHYYKFHEKGFDKVINVWGADHHGDVPGLEAGVEAIGYKGQLDTILLQFITLFKDGQKMKMSKRKGNYVTMNELIEEVGSDVVRFFFLQRSTDKHLNFDLDLAKEESEKNPVYYVQYAHARMCSILEKSGSDVSNVDLSKLKHDSELELIKQLIKYPEFIEETSKDYQVQRSTQYAMDLAKSFSSFYRDCHVLVEDKELNKARIALVVASKIVLENCLSLMGVSAPEKM